MSNEKSSARWEPPTESLRDASAALSDYFSTKYQARLDSQDSVTAMNTAMATAAAQEISKAGIDTKKLGAVSLDNLAKCRKLMEEYRERAERNSSSSKKVESPGKVPHVSLDLPDGRPEQPIQFPPINITRIPPFDFSGVVANPSDSPALISPNTADPSGLINCSVGSVAGAAVNVIVDATVGINFFPTVSGAPSPWPGTATVTWNTDPFTTFGSAVAFPAGNALSRSSFGFIIQEFDQSGNFVRTVQEDLSDVFYLSVNGNFFSGQTKVFPLTTFPNANQSTTFATVPFQKYAISFLLEYEIVAGDSANSYFGSFASAHSDTTVTSIQVSWAPVPVNTVPDVVGWLAETGIHRLESDGFQVSVAGDPVVGNFKPYVEFQDPDGGTLEPVNTTVNVTIATPVKGNGKK